jgi:hypothetical protein
VTKAFYFSGTTPLLLVLLKSYVSPLRALRPNSADMDAENARKRNARKDYKFRRRII